MKQEITQENGCADINRFINFESVERVAKAFGNSAKYARAHTFKSIPLNELETSMLQIKQYLPMSKKVKINILSFRPMLERVHIASVWQYYFIYARAIWRMLKNALRMFQPFFLDWMSNTISVNSSLPMIYKKCKLSQVSQNSLIL